MPERAYTDAELDAAIDELTDPTRLQDAQDIVMRAAPSLQRVLAAAIAEGGWFDAAHEQAVREAAGEAEGEARLRAVKTLLAEETRLGMLVGVAVGFELSRALRRDLTPETNRRTRYPMDVRFLGHAAFELSDGDTSVLIDPFLTGNPKAAAISPTRSTRPRSCSPMATATTSATPWTSPSAAGAPVLAITELAGELEGEGLEVVNCNLGGSARVRLGLGQAGAGLAHLDDPEGHRQHPRRAAGELQGHARLPPRATPRCSPICSWWASAGRSTSR